MVKRRRGFVEKFLCTYVGYIHMKVSPQNCFFYCAHIQEILIVFIGWKHVVNPVNSVLVSGQFQNDQGSENLPICNKLYQRDTFRKY